MKAMAWVNLQFTLKKPSNLLGFLFFLIPIAGCTLVYWEKTGILFGMPRLDFDKGHALVILGTFVAAEGWIVGALVTLRNSVKQHTINTLLQSRLSATYMENVRAVNVSFTGPNGELIPLTKAEVENPPRGVNLGALSYVLNYLEFVAVGIRHGDLDEGVLKSSLRGIVCSTFCVSKELIEIRRAEVVPASKARTYEHLCWLHQRWCADAQLPPRIARPVKKALEKLPLFDRLQVLITGYKP